MENDRILVIDDNEAVHQDFRRILQPRSTGTYALDGLAVDLFGTHVAPDLRPTSTFSVDVASQGQEGVAMVEQAVALGKPYALVFVDMRMPPGLDGIDTTHRIWEADPNCEVVISTAFCDYSWEELCILLPQSDRFLILRMPFDAIEIQQLATALTSRWNQARQVEEELKRLHEKLAEQAQEIARLKGAPPISSYTSFLESRPERMPPTMK